MKLSMLLDVLSWIWSKVRRKRGRLLLLVEDDSDDALLLTLQLKRIGYSVDRVATAEAAIIAIRTGKYRLAFIDIGLPLINGWQLAEMLRDEFPRFPFVITPGVPASLMGIPEGVLFTVMVKPLSYDGLRRALKEIADE